MHHFLDIILTSNDNLLVRVCAIDMSLLDHLIQDQPLLRYNILFFNLSIQFSDFKTKLVRIFEVLFYLIIQAMNL